MRTAVFGAALRVAGAFAGGAAFAAFFWGLQVLLLACHVASVQEALAPRFQAPRLAPRTQSLPPLLALPVLVLAPLALLAPALLTQDLGVPRFQDLSFSR